MPADNPQLDLEPQVARFSTHGIPAAARRSAVQEFYAAVVPIDFDLLGDGPPRVEMNLRRLPHLHVSEVTCSPYRARRTQRHVAQADDSVVLGILTEGLVGVEQKGGADRAVRAGGAALLLSDRPSCVQTRQTASMLSLVMPRALLASRPADIERAVACGLRDTPELRLLTGYMRALVQETEDLSHESGTRVAHHLLDLAALAIGTHRDAAELARHRGVKAARLAAIKADIAANLTRHDLSAGAVARRQGISPRYLRALLAEAGMSFAEHVIESRLALVHRWLCDPLRLGRPIAELAYAAGFGDLSYFNRTFRRRYGMTPSDLRRMYAQAGPDARLAARV